MEGDALSLAAFSGATGAHDMGRPAPVPHEAAKPAPVGLQSSSSTESTPPSMDTVRKAAVDLGDALEHLNRGIRYEMDESTDTLVIKIVDRETDEVIRQIPPEEILELSRRYRRYIGMCLDIEG